jgi:hypothetical protein
MRLAEPEIIAGLGHPSIHVREVVAAYLEDCGRTQSDVTRRVIAAVERFGWEEVLEFPHRVAVFELDAATLDWAIGEIDRREPGAPSENMRWHLAHMIAKAPIDAARPQLARILALDVFHERRTKLPGHYRTSADQLELRNDLFDNSPEECWALLDRHCREVADVEEFADADIAYGEALLERIATCGKRFVSEVHQILERAEINGYEEWLTGLMIILVGRLRLESAAELIFGQFDKDWDWYNEEIKYALIRIGTPSVTALVRERYGCSPWYVRLFSNAVLESVHHDTSVDDLLHVLPHEDDEELRGQLGVGLASHFDARGIEPALAVYREYPEDRERFTIIERLYAHASLANVVHPERQQWEESINAKWEEFKDNRGDLDQMIESVLQREDWVDEDDEWLDDDDWPGAITDTFLGHEEREYFPKPQPIVHTAPRVGRNESCPCGSGKKYKNCCLRNAPK